MALKFENTAEVGDMIKAYDFKPMADREPHYIVGRVVSEGMINGIACYEIKVSLDANSDPQCNRVGKLCRVPFQVSLFEHDDRVTKLAR